MKRNLTLLTSPLFLTGVSLLLLNDFVLKELWSNEWTGKLSDFSGLFVFALFWIALFPKRQRLILWSIAIGFIFWKSSFSQPLIDAWNHLDLLHISRTVDYSDLPALVVLPLAAQYNKTNPSCLRLSPVFPFVLSAFAFIATSYSYDVPIHKAYPFGYGKSVLQHKLDSIDSLNQGWGLHWKGHRADTIYVRIPSNICGQTFEAQLVVVEHGNDTSTLYFVKANHDCPDIKPTRSDFTEAFKHEILERL